MFIFLGVQNNFMFPACKNSQKWVKIQKSTDKHSPFDGLIQEVVDLSDIYLAVVCTYFEEKNNIPPNDFFATKSG